MPMAAKNSRKTAMRPNTRSSIGMVLSQKKKGEDVNGKKTKTKKKEECAEEEKEKAKASRRKGRRARRRSGVTIGEEEKAAQQVVANAGGEHKHKTESQFHAMTTEPLRIAPSLPNSFSLLFFSFSF